MRKVLLGLALLAPSTVDAQVPYRGQSGYDTGPVVACTALDGSGSARCLMPGMVPYDTTGTPLGTAANPMVTSAPAGGATAANQTNGSQQVQGNVASGAADNGNPVKIGCRYNATSVNYADGQRIDCQATRRGSIFVQVGDNNTGAAVVGVPTDNTNQALNGIYVSSQNMVYNQSSGLWAFARGDANGAYVVTRGGANIATGQVSVGTTATLIAAARATRQKITYAVTTAVQCSYGNSGVTLTTGFPLQAVAGASQTLDTNAAVYAVCASTATVGYLEQY